VTEATTTRMTPLKRMRFRGSSRPDNSSIRKHAKSQKLKQWKHKLHHIIVVLQH